LYHKTDWMIILNLVEKFLKLNNILRKKINNFFLKEKASEKKKNS
jgi:hypothetical protein